MPVILSCRSGPTDLSAFSVDDSVSIEDRYLAYLTDESRTDATLPSRIYFPESVEELATVVADAAAHGGGITVSGARTGITGGAVSHGDNLISTDRLREGPTLLESGDEALPTLRCGAGVTLEEIYERLAETPYRYPVDPTEASASVGGTVATNASGARTLLHGPTRRWVRSMTVVLADGSILDLRRGTSVAEDGVVRLDRPGGAGIEIEVQPVPIPPVKHNAGYHLAVPTDPIDLFIGSEGTLGIVAEVELALVEAAHTTLSLTLFLAKDEPVPVVRDLLDLEPAALEYMDAASLSLLAESREAGLDGGAVPPFPEKARAALYLELGLESEAALETAYESIEPILETHGIDPDWTWAGFDESDLAEMKRFRHALPERVNTIISARKQQVPEITKIGTDMAVPIDRLEEMLAHYREGVSQAGIDHCIFGHIGNGHLHVNLMPESMEQWRTGYELYHRFAERAVELGGSVAAEHGLGRLKRSFLEIQYSSEQIEAMRKVKRLLDPGGLLNPGVLFPSSSE